MKKHILFLSFLLLISVASSYAETKSVASKSKNIRSMPTSVAAMAKKMVPKRATGTKGSGPSLTNTVKLGSGPNCIGSGLCSSSNASLNIAFDAGTNLLAIGVPSEGLTPAQLTMLQAATFSFDDDWDIPQDAVQDNNIPVQIISTGRYPVFPSGPFFIITIQL